MTWKWLKPLFLDHYFKPICETPVLWTKFSPVQSSYNFSVPLGYFGVKLIPNHICKVIQLQRQ